jgi:hypothetical protein
MFTIFFANDVFWSIMCFAAFTGISYIDSDYYSTIKTPLKDKFEGINLELPIEKERVQKNQQKKNGKCFGYFLSILMFFYEIIYFHFLPYTAFMVKFIPAILHHREIIPEE